MHKQTRDTFAFSAKSTISEPSSTSLYSKGIELERKFLISDELADEIVEDLALEVETQYIKQTYLFKNNAIIEYLTDTNQWKVTLLVMGKEETFLFEETKRPEIADAVFSRYTGTNLLETECAARIRITNNVPMFTFKIPVVGGVGDNEFEVDISEYVKDSSYFDGFMMIDPHSIDKVRYVVTTKNHKYDIDAFRNVTLEEVNPDLNLSKLDHDGLCLLEIEFDSVSEYEEYTPDFNCVEVTGLKAFSNKCMAINLGKTNG